MTTTEHWVDLKARRVEHEKVAGIDDLNDRSRETRMRVYDAQNLKRQPNESRQESPECLID